MSGMSSSEESDEGNDMVTALAPNEVYDQIRQGGWLYIRPGMDAHTEWIEGVDLGKRRVLGSTAISSSMLEEWADEFGMSSNRLLRTLQRATTVGDRESPQKMEERLMKHYGIDPKTGGRIPGSCRHQHGHTRGASDYRRNRPQAIDPDRSKSALLCDQPGSISSFGSPRNRQS